MLCNLFIKNFILIKSLDLDLSPSGMSVITGETGAGKSILLDAIIFCLGGKLDANPDDSEIVTVSAEFLIDHSIVNFLADYEIEVEDQIIIKRTQHKGRKKFYISDQPVSQKLVQELGSMLLEMHGQHTQTLLGRPAQHLKILDEYASLGSDVEQVKQEYTKLLEYTKALQKLDAQQDELLKEIDYLTHLVEELDKAAIYESEESELAEKQQALKEYKKTIEQLHAIEQSLQQDNVRGAIINTQKNITRYFDDKLESMYQALDDSYAAFEKALESFETFKQEVSDIESSEDIEDRLYFIRDLARKYQVTPAELPALLDSGALKLKNLSNTIEGRDKLKNDVQEQQNLCSKLAKDLSAKRISAAKKLQSRIKQELDVLQMTGAEFVVNITSNTEKLSGNGVDTIRFTARTNKGGDLSPIDQIASGGELSRFMLAIKIALLEKGSKQTIIFDEIDTGIGGSAATSVGGRLAALGHSAQVITITHQAQVAAFAQHHLKVSKNSSGSETVTSLNILNKTESLQEIARMLSGKTITDKSLSAARELVDQAR